MLTEATQPETCDQCGEHIPPGATISVQLGPSGPPDLRRHRVCPGDVRPGMKRIGDLLDDAIDEVELRSTPDEWPIPQRLTAAGHAALRWE